MKTIQALLAVFALSALPALSQLVLNPETGLRTGTVTVNGNTSTIEPGLNLSSLDEWGDWNGNPNADFSGANLNAAILENVRSGSLTGTP